MYIFVLSFVMCLKTNICFLTLNILQPLLMNMQTQQVPYAKSLNIFNNIIFSIQSLEFRWNFFFFFSSIKIRDEKVTKQYDIFNFNLLSKYFDSESFFVDNDMISIPLYSYLIFSTLHLQWWPHPKCVGLLF